MDIQISNIVPATSTKALKKYLKPKLQRYGVTSFECNKPKGKPFAFITIPNPQAAEKFLRDHSRQGALVLVQPLLVKRGHQVPDARHVEALQRRANDAATKQPYGRRGPLRVHTVTTACGICTYAGNEKKVFAFRPEWTDRHNGMMILGHSALTITVPLHNPDSTQQSTLMKLAYGSVELVIVDRKEASPSLTFILNVAPKICHLPKKPDSMQDILKALTLDINSNNNKKDLPRRVRGADAIHEQIASTCMVYRVWLRAEDLPAVRSFLSRDSTQVPSKIDRSLPMVSPPKTFIREAEDFLRVLSASDLHFAIKFQMNRLMANAYLLPAAVESLIPCVQALNHRFNYVLVAQALQVLSRSIPFPSPDIPAENLAAKGLTTQLEEIIEQLEDHPKSKQKLSQRYEHLFLIHRALVTPTGVYLSGPELEPVNRVLRQYSEFAETHFLRVNFQDEDNEPINFDRNSSLETIHDVWFKSVLHDGISIGGRSFEFLGFSNSSLKDQSCWFMAPFKHLDRYLDAWTVIKGLGNFSHIRAPAKCAARIGQAFSDTPGGAVNLSKTQILMLADVKKNGFCFSDGCGTISKELLDRIWATYRRNCNPTLFQVRHAGAKGMVSLDDRLQGEVLCLRESMTKFQSAHNFLEICNAARRPLPFFLNRQLVKILEDLEVPGIAFHILQDKAVAELREAASTPIDAAKFLDRKDVGKACNLSWLIEKLHLIGIDARDDRFLQWAIEHCLLAELRMIKYKARIPVEDAHTLYGVMDETGILPEHQIFCRQEHKVRTGVAAITRSPALHPGDVQLVTAVKVPHDSPLMALDNCVVFSQHGSRDLASKLSGGDLDGDLFNVIFEPSLRPNVIHTPADYKPPSPIDLYRPMTRQDIMDWFIKFMKNDHLAKIALTHVQLADEYPKGTLDNDCLTLAELHSTAVDFQKTGVEVNLTRMPKFKNHRPHFMAPDPRLLRNLDEPIGFEPAPYIESEDEEGVNAAINPDGGKGRMLYYSSHKILGQLYDKIDESAFLKEIDEVMPAIRGTTAMPRLWQHIQAEAAGIQWLHMEDWAWGLREEYEELALDLMFQYGYSPREPLSEIEVFMGSIVGKKGALPSRRVREDSRTMKDRFNEHVAYIVRRIVHGNIDSLSQVEFATEADWADTTAARDQALERSMACLDVALREGTRHTALGSKSMVSFQYVAGMVALRELTIFQRRNATHIVGLPILPY